MQWVAMARLQREVPGRRWNFRVCRCQHRKDGMKWFIKFKISNALDADTSADAGVPAIQAGSELAEFERKVIAVDAALKQQVPGMIKVSEGLHESIMRGVARAKASSGGTSLGGAVRALWPRWVPVCVAGVLVLVLGWLVVRDSQPMQRPPEDIASAAAPLLSLEDLAKSAPAALTGPLATELHRVQADLDATARFLLASVP